MDNIELIQKVETALIAPEFATVAMILEMIK